MSSLFDLTTPGLSLWSIPAVFALAFYPSTQKFSLITKTIGYNNVQPRQNIERLESHPHHKEVHAKCLRLDGAHKNGYEIFPLWASAVLAANYTSLDHKMVNTVALAFISLRALYNYIYITQTSETAASTRTAVYFVGLSAPMYLLYKAGVAMNH